MSNSLLESCQRYKFKSNSQLRFFQSVFYFTCWNLVKDINSKAIHNHSFAFSRIVAPVGILSKI